jgi:chemotaxis protein methyltransferase CheR
VIPRSDPLFPPAGLADADRARVCALVRRRTGVVIGEDKGYLVEARLTTFAAREGFTGLADLLDALHTEPESGPLHRSMVEALLIAETSWFRDLHPFESLRTRVLPALIERRARQRTLDLWCAACATGQEPYSLAILLLEHFPQLADWRVRLIASDVSLTMLARARDASYSALEMNRGLPASLLVRWFEKIGDRWHVRDAVRRQVDLREINLAGPWPELPAMDVILLRNALIYFDTSTRKAVLRNVARRLRPDGVLVMGAGESPVGFDDAFVPVPDGRTVSFRLAA